MKKVLILFLFLPTILVSQEIENVNFKLNLLKGENKFKNDTTGINKVNLPDYYCYKNIDKKSILKWSVQDLNEDGKKDLIFSGNCQPYSNSAIFLNKSNSLEFAFEHAGEVLHVKKNKVNIFKKSCCCDYYSDLIEVTVEKGSAFVSNILSFHIDTEILNDSKLQVKSVSGILRTSPKLDDVLRKDACKDGNLKGNQIIKIEDKKVIVLAEKNKWLQVLVKLDNLNSIIGWIQKN